LRPQNVGLFLAVSEFFLEEISLASCEVTNPFSKREKLPERYIESTKKEPK